MPTLQKPKLVDNFSHAQLSKIFETETTANLDQILEKLNFHTEHGRIGDHDGRYDDVVRRAQIEVINEIAGALSEAASASNIMSTGVLIASSKVVARNPSLLSGPELPGALDILAGYYTRADENPGTYFQDITGQVASNAPPPLMPSAENVRRAAYAAISALRRDAAVGRPKSVSNEILARKLGPLFLRYNQKLTRISTQDYLVSGSPMAKDGRAHQVETGAFSEFLRLVLVPLQRHLASTKKAPVSELLIVKIAAGDI